MTRTELVAKLRSLLAGERTDAATAEAKVLLDELEADRRAVVKRPRAAAPVDDEKAKWAKTLRRIGRGGGAASTRVWNPGGGRDHEPAWTRRNEEKTYLRNWSPWR